MTLPVPLTVRIGDEHVTREVQSLTFRKEAVGGCRSIAFSLARPLSDLGGLDPLAKVCVYDGRNAETVVEGRLADTGRGASADGERWDCVAFGPVQHASDETRPLVYADNRFEGWSELIKTHPNGSFSIGAMPDGSLNTIGMALVWPEGTTLTTLEHIAGRYSGIQQAGMKLARYGHTRYMGTNEASTVLDTVASTNGDWAAFDIGTSSVWESVPGESSAVVGTDFANGRNTIDMRVTYSGAGAVVGGNFWAFVNGIAVRSMLVDSTGAEITTGYTSDAIYAHEVVADLLGRVLTGFDGAGASIATNTTPIYHLSYLDGITAEQVLADLMKIEAAYRWYATPDSTGNGYGFRWELWPTSVRYEATLDDGGSFPISAQGLYNKINVRWVGAWGVTQITTRTIDCSILDDAGIVRSYLMDLGTEVGSATAAAEAGDNFLAINSVPKNSGTLTVARPIRDLSRGTLVQPWEIEPGELVRIRGVEAYPDAFNADTNDGQGVFRIHAVDYTTEGNVATLALDSDPRETEDALVKLMNQRARR